MIRCSFLKTFFAGRVLILEFDLLKLLSTEFLLDILFKKWDSSPKTARSTAKTVELALHYTSTYYTKPFHAKLSFKSVVSYF